MTVEIRELVIKTTVSDPAQFETKTTAAVQSHSQLLVKDCVAEVLKILKREKER